LSGSVVAAQGKAVVAGGKHSEGKKSTKKYLPDKRWDALSADATCKPTKSRKKDSSDKCDESVLNAMKANIKKPMKPVSVHQECDENGDHIPPISPNRDKGPSHSQDVLGRTKEDPKTLLALNRTCDKKDITSMVPCSEEALPELLLGMELFNKKQISGAMQVREFLEKQGSSSPAECGLMLNPEGIPGCKDTPENVASRELVMQNPPSKTIEDCQLHANDLKFTNWRGQKIGEITQVLDPGVKESDESVVAYLADDIPGVEVTAVNVSENCSLTYPIVKILGVDVKLSDVTFTGVGKNLDAESTEVEVDTGAYGSEAHDAVP
jgi:hypothetical protein